MILPAIFNQSGYIILIHQSEYLLGMVPLTFTIIHSVQKCLDRLGRLYYQHQPPQKIIWGLVLVGQCAVPPLLVLPTIPTW